MIHSTRKILEEAGDKVTDEEKTSIEAAISDLEESIKGDDKSNIETKTQKLTETSSTLAQKMYAEQAQSAAQEAGDTTSDDAGDDAVDAEFEEVKDDK